MSDKLIAVSPGGDVPWETNGPIVLLSELDPNRDTIPVFDDERGFRNWARREIYTGPNGAGKYVPNVDDMVTDWDNGFYRVIEVDKTTGLSRLWLWNLPMNPNGNPDYDTILGSGPGLMQSEAQRIYVNKAVTPFTMVPDVRLHTYSQTVKYYKVFRGYDIGEFGDVISIYYTSNGLDANENVPLDLVATPDKENYSIMGFTPAFTLADLKDGDPVTVVVYNDQGSAVSKEVLFVCETAFIRPVEMGQRVVTGIELISPFLAQNDATTLEVPLNMTVEALTMMCRVHYNDGYRDMAITGGKVKLTGTEQYIATIQGERIPLVLTYFLSPEEAAITGNEVGDRRFVSKPYWAKTVAVDGAYSVKLFPVPSWIDEFSGWGLEWYLYNLDRKQAYYVTPYVTWNSNSPPFRPLRYGIQQDIAVTVELSQIDPRLNSHRHTQSVGITLMADGLTQTTPWLIQYSQNADKLYGRNLEARFTFNSVGNWTLNIASGYTNLSLWLDDVYYAVQPLFIDGQELKAPQPTHFVLILDDIRREYPLSSWNKNLTVPTGMNAGEGLVIQWIQRLPNTDLQLACSPMVVRHDGTTKTS